METKRGNLIFRWKLLVGIACVLSIPSWPSLGGARIWPEVNPSHGVLREPAAAAVAKPASDDAREQLKKEILQSALRLSSEDVAEETFASLRAKPREQLVSAIREILRESNRDNEQDVHLALKVAVVLGLNELTTDVLEVAKRNNDVFTVLALRKFATAKNKAAIEKFLMERLVKEPPAATRMAIVEMLPTDAFSLKEYQDLLRDESYGVRHAAFDQFLSGRDKLSTSEQAERFRSTFTTMPYQVRLKAMQAFSDLELGEREKLKGAVNAQICASEKHPQVKEICLRLVRDRVPATKPATKKEAK